MEEIDVLFARSPEVRERLAQNTTDRRVSIAGSVHGPMGRRASTVSMVGGHRHLEKVQEITHKELEHQDV